MLILALALLLDWYAGEPDFLWKRFPHPVVLIGRVIDWFDGLRERSADDPENEDKNNQRNFLRGLMLVGALFVLSLISASAIAHLAGFLGPLWWLVEIPVVAVLLAQKSLWDHVTAVADALKKKDLEDGRQAVSMVVGRDVSQLDESGVSKAALESLAENFSDGVVAPALWYAAFGLPGIIFYKAINTADSMIGHYNEKYEYFGKPAAVLDDFMNWPAARLSALLVSFSVLLNQGVTRAKAVLMLTLRDAAMHRSPNAGWPETAFAAALGVALGGARRYGETTVNASLLNATGREKIRLSDLVAGLNIFWNSCITLIGLCFFLWLAF